MGTHNDNQNENEFQPALRRFEAEALPKPEGAVPTSSKPITISARTISRRRSGRSGSDIHNSGSPSPQPVDHRLRFSGSRVGRRGLASFFGGTWRGRNLTSTFDWFFIHCRQRSFVIRLSRHPRLPRSQGLHRSCRCNTRLQAMRSVFAMLFAPACGIGLSIFGVLEPVYYFATPGVTQRLGRLIGIVDGETELIPRRRAARLTGPWPP